LVFNKLPMSKTLFLFIILLPFAAFSQYTISGQVLNNTDKKPVESASIFLSNASVGGKTDKQGNFTLYNAKPGKYQLVISSIGFESYSQNITVGNGNIALPAIYISPKILILNEVKIKSGIDPNRMKYYYWFLDEFLGNSELAADCKILNPEMLDFDYNDTTGTLTASSADFLQIENPDLGYKIKYLLTKFNLNNLDRVSQKVHYEGSVLFEEMKGTAKQKKRCKKKRQEVYEGSQMHFLRSALEDDLYDQGFRALHLRRYPNPDRPTDSLINAKIKYYKNLKAGGSQWRDSLSSWNKKLMLPKILEKFVTSKDSTKKTKGGVTNVSVTERPMPLNMADLVKPTNQQGLFALGFGNVNDALYIVYNKYQHFYLSALPTHLYDPYNRENTLVNFNAPYVFFDTNGAVLNPNSMTFSGVWGRNRIAELLPVDYEPDGNSALHPPENIIADTIITKLNNYLTTNPAEKAYLQFDKPYYAAGDTIYFKAYITKGERHELSDLSGVLHVDLINTHNKTDQSIKLQIDTGVTWGDFALPDTLPTGDYRIRAYTQWMRNDGEKDFFDKVIPIGSSTNRVPESMVKPPVQQVTLKPDIQFFPEGGKMVTGIRSKVAFKAVGTNGMGIDVKGKVVDNTGKQISSFASTHLGMGYFYLSPEEGKTYKAELTYANGQQNSIDMPAPETNGIALSVDNDLLPKTAVSIKASNAFYQENKDKDYTLVIYSGGITTTVACKLDSEVINLDILKRHLRTGIATITLFTLKGEPLCERLFFVENYDQLSINLSGEKKVYSKREKVLTKFKALNRVGNGAEGHFSVSVIDEGKVPADENKENNILSYLLLTSDLKGNIEQPNYYFADSSATARDNLDVLLLTQGYRRFEWKQVLDSIKQPFAYQPEKGIEIAGEVKNLANKPIANAAVTLISPNGGRFLSDTADDKGIFRFSNLVFTDTLHFVLSAINANGKNATKITYFNDGWNKPPLKPIVPQIADTVMSTYLDYDKLQHQEVLNYVYGKEIRLKEVKIKDKKPDDDYQTQSLAGAGHADQVMQADEIGRIQGPLSTSLNGRLHGVTFIPHSNGQFTPQLTIGGMSGIGSNAPQPMLIIIDGAEGGDINLLNANDVETVEVLKGANASIYGMAGGGGVLVITTKRTLGLSANEIASIGVLPIAPIGFYMAREFYSPGYNSADLVTRQRDLRSTIYWQPELQTDKDGNASFEYYNADGTGTYKMVIEGIDNNGNIGRQVYRYKVQ
jgi:TonB-dependent SusC/RagA subfamily outer membrane receptor